MKSPRPFCIHACIYNSKCKTWIYFSNLIKSYKHNSRSVEFTTKGCRRRIITQVFQFRLYLAYCANNNKPTLAHILTICILSFYTYTYNTASIYFRKVYCHHVTQCIHNSYIICSKGIFHYLFYMKILHFRAFPFSSYTKIHHHFTGWL